MKLSWLVFNPPNKDPVAVHQDYHELIVWIRRNKITTFLIYEHCEDTDFSAGNITEKVMKDAWSKFEYIDDKNY